MVRRALPADREHVLDTVTAAFAADPAWAFMLGEQYEQLAPLFAGALFDMRVDAGNVWVAQDARAVAMWEAPGESGGAVAGSERIWARYIAAAGARVAERHALYNDALARASAPLPSHWYLGVLATHPAHQRQGLATSVLAPVLCEADASATPCCLETSTEANRRFYERRGFTQATDVPLAAGPPTWWLCRAPQS
jgi:GNAT superfamily N-acetyltransferase